MLLSETRMVTDGQKRPSSTTHPTQNLKTAKNYLLSLNTAKESLVMLHQMHRIKNMTNF